jgi:hypothetical protein
MEIADYTEESSRAKKIIWAGDHHSFAKASVPALYIPEPPLLNFQYKE